MFTSLRWNANANANAKVINGHKYEDDDGPLKMSVNWNKISFFTSLDNFITFCWIAEDDLMINLQVLTYF